MSASVSIITRTTSRPALLKRTMDSILQQTYKDWELILVDGGGEPKTQELVDSFAGKVKHIHAEQELSLGGMLNKGIEESEGRYITILDDDDTWDSLFLQTLVEALELQLSPKVKGVCCHTTCIEEELEENKWVSKFDYPLDESTPGDITISDIVGQNRFTINAFLFERAALSRVGLYDEELVVAEDWDFNMRFLMHWDLIVVPAALANYHRRPKVTEGSETNTFTKYDHQHRYAVSSVINKHIRLDLAGKGEGLGMLMSISRTDIRINHGIKSLQSLIRLYGNKIGKIDSRTKTLKDKLV